MTSSPSSVAAPRELDALFSPTAVAVVGASNDESKYGNWISVQALRMADRRPVYLVNRRGESVLGERTYRSLAELPERVDLVIIAVPAVGFEQAIEDALAAGIRAIVGITAGFSELGDHGQAREAALVRRVRDAGAVLLGPNCLGVQDSSTSLYAVSNALPSGPVGLISQSGNMALELSQFLADRGLGFSRFASLGNTADLGPAELIRAYTRHPDTELIAVYCEDFGDGRAFVAAAAEATAAGKPVVLLPVGGSEASARGAQSHTGSLTSGSAVIEAACRVAGIDRVASLRRMADLLTALHRFGPRPASRIAVISDGGGHAATACDIAEANGLSVPVFTPSKSAALRTELPPSAGVANPIDIAGAGERDITSFTRTLDIALDGSEVDAVLVTGYFGGYGGYGGELAAAETATATAMGRSVGEYGKPVVVHTMHPDSAAAGELRDTGVPVFRTVEEAVQTLGMLADHESSPSHLCPEPEPAAPVTGDDYWSARELLRTGGVRFPNARLARTAEAVATAATELNGPLVLKALGLLHKSDSGGVALGLSAVDDVRTAHADMHRRLHAPGYCVEEMADTSGGVELIAGVWRDPRFGVLAMVGLGGVFTEVFGDVRFALAPVTEEQALDMLTGLRAAALLRGARGRQPVDLTATAGTVAAITRIAAEHPEIAELEVNPLLAGPEHCTALDARIVLER